MSFPELVAADVHCRHPDKISPLIPVPVTVAVSSGSYWSLQVDRAAPHDAGVPAASVDAKILFEGFAASQDALPQLAETRRRTLQGLGLYVLSTLLLSVQATSAKLLGQCIRKHMASAFVTHGQELQYLYLFRARWAWYCCHGSLSELSHSGRSGIAPNILQTRQAIRYQVGRRGCC